MILIQRAIVLQGCTSHGILPCSKINPKLKQHLALENFPDEKPIPSWRKPLNLRIKKIAESPSRKRKPEDDGLSFFLWGTLQSMVTERLSPVVQLPEVIEQFQQGTVPKVFTSARQNSRLYSGSSKVLCGWGSGFA